MRIANCCGQRSSILLMPTCRIFTNMHCRPIFYIFANGDHLRAVLLSPALPTILPSWSMQMKNERWTQRTNQCCSWFIIWWLLCPSALFSLRLYLPAQWSDIVLIHVVMMYQLWWSLLALSPKLQMPVASRLWRHAQYHHRVSNSPWTWALANSCSKPTQMIGKVFTVTLAWQVCKSMMIVMYYRICSGYRSGRLSCTMMCSVIVVVWHTSSVVY